MNHSDVSALFKRGYRALRTNLRTRCGIPDAEIDDLAQEVFMRLLRFPEAAIKTNPMGYLFTIGANVANEWRKRKYNWAPRDSEWLEELVLDDRLEPQNILEQEALDKQMQQIIDSMPTRRGVILLMHVHDNKTYHQIAKELGLTYRLVLREIVKAYTTFREEMFK